MSGFRNFVLRGNLVDVAVAFIMAASFAVVVTTFTKWLTSLLPSSADNVFSTKTPFGAFMNAVIAFLLLAAVVYFAVVLPYTKAKEKFFPSPPPGTPEDVELLRQIRDLLQQNSTQA
jgi:large conductance mechanosensitive channel